MYIVNDAKTAIINTENISWLVVEEADPEDLGFEKKDFSSDEFYIISAYLQNAKIVMGFFEDRKMALAVYKGLTILIVKFPKSKCIFMDKLIDEVLGIIDFDNEEDNENEALDWWYKTCAGWVFLG